MDKLSLNLWMIRIYAVVVLIVVTADIFEGAAFKLVLGLASIAIIVQSFLIGKVNTGSIKR